jgi:glycosyltransferase involved in cell wall biosynthesis
MAAATTSYRVLHLIHSPQRRGAEIFAAQLAARLEASGRFHNGVCSLFVSKDSNFPVDGLPFFRLDARPGVDGRLGADPRLVVSLAGVLRQFRPHIVMAHGSDTLKYSALARPFYGNAPTVYRNIDVASNWATTPMKVRLNRWFLRRVAAVVSVSQFSREDFIRLYHMPAERVSFIPNGVDVTPFANGDPAATRTTVRRELGIDPRALVLISVGALTNQKAHLGLLPLLAQSSQDGLNSEMILVGEGPLRGQLEQQARDLNIGPRLRLLGGRDDVPRLLAAADLFLLPSKTEGMPAVLIEAGLGGLPTVAFSVGGVNEVVEDQVSGSLVPPGDYPAFWQAVTTLARDPQRRGAMGQAARQRCRELFDIRKVAGEYEDLFVSLLRKGRGWNPNISREGM